MRFRGLRSPRRRFAFARADSRRSGRTSLPCCYYGHVVHALGRRHLFYLRADARRVGVCDLAVRLATTDRWLRTADSVGTSNEARARAQSRRPFIKVFTAAGFGVPVAGGRTVMLVLCSCGVLRLQTSRPCRGAFLSPHEARWCNWCAWISTPCRAVGLDQAS